MVTQQKEVSYRLRFWELYITHNLTPRDSCHEWSPTIPRRVTCQPKDGPPLTQGWLPHFAMLGPSWLRLTPFSRGCPCCLIWSSLAPSGPITGQHLKTYTRYGFIKGTWRHRNCHGTLWSQLKYSPHGYIPFSGYICPHNIFPGDICPSDMSLSNTCPGSHISGVID